MTQRSSWTGDAHELEIQKLLGFIASSAADAMALGGATGPEERFRHEHVQDLLTDACDLAYVAARARIAHLDPDDVHLRAEALADAVAGLEEVIRQARRGIERLRTRPVAPPTPLVAPSRNGRRSDQTNRLTVCPAAVA